MPGSANAASRPNRTYALLARTAYNISTTESGAAIGYESYERNATSSEKRATISIKSAAAM